MQISEVKQWRVKRVVRHDKPATIKAGGLSFEITGHRDREAEPHSDGITENNSRHDRWYFDKLAQVVDMIRRETGAEPVSLWIENHDGGIDESWFDDGYGNHHRDFISAFVSRLPPSGYGGRTVSSVWIRHHVDGSETTRATAL